MISNFVRAALVSLGFVTVAVAPASALTMTFDETGACSLSSGATCTGVAGAGPYTGGLEFNVLAIFGNTLGNGIINVLDPMGTISDQLVWTNSDGVLSGDTATLMYFFSYDSDGLMADVGFAPLSGAVASVRESADGTFSYSSFNITSEETTPIPGALSLFATGIAGLGLLGWRMKQRA